MELSYKVILTSQASKDLRGLIRAGYGDKANGILKLLSEDPFRSPPPWKKLSGEFADYYSRRLNRTDRAVYMVMKGEGGNDPVIVSCMRTHYSGMFALTIL